MAKNSKKTDEQPTTASTEVAKYQLMPVMATFDDNGFCDNPGFALIYRCDHISKEYLDATYEFRGVGVSIPVDSYLDAPQPPDNDCAIVRGESGWQYVADFRGRTVYSTHNQQATTVAYLGEVQDGFTLIAPTSPFDEWDGAGWVFSTDKEHQFLTKQANLKKTELLEQAEQVIEDLIDLVESDKATADERASLKLWRGFRSDIRRIKPSDAPNITWPDLPPHSCDTL